MKANRRPLSLCALAALCFTAQPLKAEMMLLTCDVAWTTGAPQRQLIDVAVDMSARTVGDMPAQIENDYIKFEGQDSKGRTITRISRLSGAISMYFEGSGTMQGMCRRAAERKF